MSHFRRVSAGLLLVLLSLCTAQAQSQRRGKDPKPEPTKADLVEYIRGALLSMSPNDGLDDNIDVRFDMNTNVMTIVQPAGHCDFFLYSFNANDAVWDVYDPSDTFRTREKLLRLTMVSTLGKPARTCYDKENREDTTLLNNRARFLFSLSKTDEVPNFSDKMTTAFQKLIALCGGEPATKMFN
jgi:hypothetical protein